MKKVIKLYKPKKPIVGSAIFFFVFVYLLIILCNYGNSKHIAGYEVKAGSLAVDNTYRGICIRSEKLFNVNDNGYINYYAREGEKVANGSMIYTIDESGKLSELLRNGLETTNGLTETDMNELKTQIMTYRNEYTDKSFESVYDFKFSVAGTVNKLANKNVMDSLNSISDRSVLDLVNFGRTSESGIVVYSTDGLEGITNTDINKELFDETNYQKQQLLSNTLVDNGDPAYKLITEENWGIVIPVDEDRYNELLEKTYIKIRFLKTGDESWGKVNCFTGGEKEYYCRFDFTNSMITYATDRYLDIELLLSSQKGLKIPNSAIVEKEFYLIPQEYLVAGGGKDEVGFNRESRLEDGSTTIEFVPAQIYYSDDDNDVYYIDTNTLRLNDYLILDSNINNKYAVGRKDKLIGVYNMNKGFADFTQITILYQNREYSIVKSNTDYGLSVYDHIVLEGEAVTDDEFVFE